MTQYFFEKPGHAALYQKYRLPSPNEINDLILNYLQTKKGKPFTLAVDVGCGSGQSTRGLTSYFEEVVGIDISEAQIEEAKKMERSDNVSYRQGLAEELGFQDGSVDLVTVGAAAQWFDLEKFMKEIDRVLKPKGCLALYCYTVPCILNFDDCSETLTQIIQDLFTELKPYETIATKRVWNEYRDLFDAIPFPEKARAKDIFITFKKPVSWFIGYLNSSVLFQTYLREKLEDAKAFMENTEQRLLKAMGVSSEAIVEFRTKYYCLLASKPE